MLQIQERVPLGPKTTMRIGGAAQYYAELKTKENAEEATRFAIANGVPLIPLGGGSNTIFADDVIHALVVRMKADTVTLRAEEAPWGRDISAPRGRKITVEAGKILGSLVAELAKQNLDLSALTGILGTVGGAIFGNAGQGPTGVWIDSFVESVTAFVDGTWQTFSREACHFRYRESMFKDIAEMPSTKNPEIPTPIIIWEVTLSVPSRPQAEVEAEIERLIKRRIETQPHLKTAGSCFKALPDGTPAWKRIDAAGLRGHRRGDIQISEKHANFLLNTGRATFADALAIVADIRGKVTDIAGIEMRFYGESGRIVKHAGASFDEAPI